MVDKIKYKALAYKNHFEFWKSQLTQFESQFLITQQLRGRETSGETRKTITSKFPDALCTMINRITNGSDPAACAIFLAALGVLFSRYKHSEEVIIHASPLLNPVQSSVKDAPIPACFRSSGSFTLREYLNKVLEVLKSSYQYGDFPLSVIDDNAELQSNILFRYRNLHQPVDSTTYHIVFEIERTVDSINYEISFNTSAFDEPFIKQICERFQLVVRYFSNLDECISQLDITTEEERAQLLNFSSGKECLYDQKTLLPQLIRRKCSDAPDSVAVVFGNERLSYGKLEANATKLAHYLVEVAKVTPNQKVGIFMERSDLMIQSIVATVFAGAAYVPLDINSPKERRRAVIEDSQMSVILIDSKFMFDFEGFQGELFAVDIQLDGLVDAAVPAQQISPSDLAYVIYTSGSTGTPKGVMVRHENILNTIQWRIREYAFNEGDRFLQIPSIAFDSSVEDIFCALCSGASLVICTEDQRKNVMQLNQLIGKEAVTHFLVTPSFYYTLLNYLSEENSLRVVTVAGEAVTQNLVQKHFRTLRSVRLFNEYGPTETSVCATARELFPECPIDIGSPISNASVYILDLDRRLAPIGIPGEIYIGGKGVGPGYITNPGLTSEKFISLKPGKKEELLYRSGDLGFWTDEGSISFMGRKDLQIKLNGIRVELQDIEATIRRFDGVEDCRVINTESGLVAGVTVDKLIQHTLQKVVSEVEGDPSFLDSYMTFPNGMGVRYKNVAETKLTYEEIFRDKLYFKYGISVKDGDTVFDVGANIGLFSLFIGVNFPKTKLYCFEPLSPIYETLSKNLRLYPINATAHNFGFSDSVRSADFFYYYNNTASSTVYGDVKADQSVSRSVIANKTNDLTLADSEVDFLIEEGSKYETYTCQLDSLSDFIRRENITNIDLLKLDAEKSELDILSTLSRDDWRKIRQVVAEVHDIDDALEKIKALFAQNDFTCDVDQPDFLANTDIYYVYAKGPGSDVHQVSEWKTDNFREMTKPDDFTSAVMDFCKTRLPVAMVPSSVHLLASFPVTINGKLDVHALRTKLKESSAVREIVNPSNPLEHLLVSAWSLVMGKPTISITDNFFHVGGDSIKAIQIASRMHKEGYKIEVKDIFEHQTIQKLAANAKRVVSSRDQAEIVGDVPLTPIQKALFPLDKPEPHHFNQALMLSSAVVLEKEMVEEIFSALIAHHDALRITLKRGETEWEQYNQPIEAIKIKVKEYYPADSTEIETLGNQVQQSIDLENGPLIRVALLHLSSGDRLLVVIHHMVVDGVSWRILLEDLGTLLTKYQKGEKLELPEKTDSFQKWSNTENTLARTGKFHDEINYWNNVLFNASRCERLPLKTDDSSHDVDMIEIAFSREDSLLLLNDANVPYNTRINELLLTALARAINATSGIHDVFIHLEGHGREEIDPSLNITRTVGWFTSVYPIVLHLTTADLEKQIVATKEHLRSIPNNGIGYGILRYLAPDKQLIEVRRPDILFNYLGQFDADIEQSTFDLASESFGDAISRAEKAMYPISVLAVVSDRQLSISITYDRNAIDESYIKALASSYKSCLSDLVGHCISQRRKTITPSDVSGTGISLESIDRIRSLFN